MHRIWQRLGTPRAEEAVTATGGGGRRRDVVQPSMVGVGRGAAAATAMGAQDDGRCRLWGAAGAYSVRHDGDLLPCLEAGKHAMSLTWGRRMFLRSAREASVAGLVGILGAFSALAANPLRARSTFYWELNFKKGPASEYSIQHNHPCLAVKAHQNKQTS